MWDNNNTSCNKYNQDDQCPCQDSNPHTLSLIHHEYCACSGYIYGSTAIFWALAAFQFLNLYTISTNTWTGDQTVARPLSTHRTAQTQNKRKQTSMSLVGFEHTTLVFEETTNIFALDRAATVIGFSQNMFCGKCKRHWICLSLIGFNTFLSFTRWYPPRAVRVPFQAKPSHMEFMSKQSRTGAGFLRVHRIPLLIFIAPDAPRSSPILSSTLYSLDTESVVK
jgi:hypothetical protein